ncbi:MAG: serine hydrolase, partial [Bacteroidota bacterium]
MKPKAFLPHGPKSAALALLFSLFFLPSISLFGKVNLKKLDKAIAASFETFAPTGLAVAVVKDGEIVYKSAFGTKNVEVGGNVNTASLFNIASCSKAFTAACIALLVDDGKLKWEDKVIDYIPGFRLDDPYITSEITVRDLLCHRSGLGTFYGDLLWYGTNYSNEEIIRRMRYLPIKREFRTEFGYQNNMYMIAGEIVEKVTGRTWSEFLTERFFKPLQMNNSRPSNDELFPGQDIARGHIEGKLQEIYDFNATKPAASIYSNVEELANWATMLLSGGKFKGETVLKPSAIQAMFTPHTLQTVSGSWQKWGVNFKSYGLGWGLWDYAGRKVAEHNGGMPGYISKVTIVPSEKLGVIVLNNGMDGLINDVVRWKVLDAFLEHEGEDWDKTFLNFKKMGKEWGEKRKQGRLDSRVEGTKMSLAEDKYLGTYTDEMYGNALVEMRDGALHFTLEPA